MTPPDTILYTAAHGGFAHESVALGGGAAVCNRLMEEWGRTKPFELHMLEPAMLGPSAPAGRDLIAFDERRYARFCFEFGAAATEAVLRYDPARCAVLCNDVSEAPDVRRLAQAGFRVYTIFHVDVVAYVAAIYGRGLLQPETLVRWYDRLERSPLRVLLPRLAELIFRKQRESVEYSRGIVLPSEGMRTVLHACYPALPPERVHVIPWGLEAPKEPADESEVARLRDEFGVPDNALALLTLSRISPEKGQDALLRALIEWERRGDLPTRPLWLFLCGDAAYMMGQRYLERLHSLAARLKRIRVVFPGYVTGARKQAFFRMADVYVFPSKHESYGLTLLEALRAGLPAICLDHHGARSVMRAEFGEIVTGDAVSGLLAALRRMLADENLRRHQGAAARAFAATQNFSDSAARLAALLLTE